MASSKRFSRRRFIQRGAVLASAGAAAPYIIPRHVLAAPEKAGANERIGVGYIGVGRRAQGLLGLPRDGQVVAAADVHQKRAEATAARFKAKALTDYRKMLEMREVDAVVIATPDHWRALHCIHACQAGKDIYAEKPLTLTIKEGRAICNAVKKYKIVFQTGSQQRSMAPNRIGCELVRNGVIGKVHTVIGSNYPSPWLMNLPGQPVPDGLDWDAWCGQAPVVPYHIDLYTPRRNPGWISVWPYSGGEMTGWGAHGLDQIQWALGADSGGPIEVWSEGGPYKMPTFDHPISRGEGNVFSAKHKVYFRYSNDVIVKLDSGSGAGGTFCGEKGKIVVRRNSFSCDPPELANEKLPENPVRLYVSNSHMGNWFDCMKTRKDPICNAEVGHRSCTVCHLGNIGRWLGRKLKWDPQKEIFPSDDEANTYLDRPKRKGYELPDPV